MSHIGGFGPWFCALYFNLAKGPKKQTDLRVHTYPLLFERIMNGPKAGSVGGKGWVIIMMIGHFNNWNDAIAFHTLWSKQTRGKNRRIQRGLHLFNNYTKKYGLQMWVQPLTRTKAIKAWDAVYKDQEKLPIDIPIKLRYNQLPSNISSDKKLLVGTVHKMQLERKKQ